jgi:hypothetical protein
MDWRGWIEGGVVIALDELGRALEMRMAAELLAHVAVQADVMEEVVALEDAVLLHHPEVLLGHEGLEDGGRDVRRVERTEGVADVVQQRAHHVLLVAAVAQCAGRGLQRMGVAVDRKAAVVAFEDLQVPDHAGGQAACKLPEFAADQLPVFARALLHAGETRPFAHLVVSFLWGLGHCRRPLDVQLSRI